MTPAQCRAARAFIAMSQFDLARAAVVPVASVTDFETGILTLRPPDLDAIQHTLERAGIEIIDGDTGGRANPRLATKGEAGMRARELAAHYRAKAVQTRVRLLAIKRVDFRDWGPSPPQTQTSRLVLANHVSAICEPVSVAVSEHRGENAF
jgi:hypothetical protein